MNVPLAEIHRRIRETEEVRKTGKVPLEEALEGFQAQVRAERGCPARETMTSFCTGSVRLGERLSVWRHLYFHRCPFCRREVAQIRGLLVGAGLGGRQPGRWARLVRTVRSWWTVSQGDEGASEVTPPVAWERPASTSVCIPAAASGETVVEPDAPLGVIPAWIALDPRRLAKSQIEVFKKPTVSPRGELVTRVRLSTVGPPPSGLVELLLVLNLPPEAKWVEAPGDAPLVLPAGRLVEPGKVIEIGAKELVSIPLPAEFQRELQHIEDLPWEKLPISFLIRPIPGAGPGIVPQR